MHFPNTSLYRLFYVMSLLLRHWYSKYRPRPKT